MLRNSESISYYSRLNLAIWMTMAFQAGLLNMGGFLACHHFVSHVTGFATMFGKEVSHLRFESALEMALVPLFFFFGAMISGQLVDLRLKQHKKPRYYLTFGAMFFATLFVLVVGETGYFGEFGDPSLSFREIVLLVILCLICGIQNGTVTSVSRAIVRTTHLTGILTDLGIGVVRVLNRQKMNIDISDEIKANYMRFGIISFFVTGSVIGAFVFERFGYLGFILPALTSGTLLLGAIYFQVRPAQGRCRLFPR